MRHVTRTEKVDCCTSVEQQHADALILKRCMLPAALFMPPLSGKL